MEDIRLVLPHEGYRQQVLEYRQEFLEHGDTMAGCGGLDSAAGFEEWLAQTIDNRSEATVRPGLVPATLFLAVSADRHRLVGMIDIRHRLNGYLLQYAGNIGYSIRPSMRRQGYGARMLGLALEECRAMGLNRVLITCDRDNTASARTMLHNGAVLENEVAQDGRMIQRYWITLS